MMSEEKKVPTAILKKENDSWELREHGGNGAHALPPEDTPLYQAIILLAEIFEVGNHPAQQKASHAIEKLFDMCSQFRDVNSCEEKLKWATENAWLNIPPNG